MCTTRRGVGSSVPRLGRGLAGGHGVPACPLPFPRCAAAAAAACPSRLPPACALPPLSPAGAVRRRAAPHPCTLLAAAAVAGERDAAAGGPPLPAGPAQLRVVHRKGAQRRLPNPGAGARCVCHYISVAVSISGSPRLNCCHPNLLFTSPAEPSSPTHNGRLTAVSRGVLLRADSRLQPCLPMCLLFCPPGGPPVRLLTRPPFCPSPSATLLVVLLPLPLLPSGPAPAGAAAARDPPALHQPGCQRAARPGPFCAPHPGQEGCSACCIKAVQVTCKARKHAACMAAAASLPSDAAISYHPALYHAR